MERHEVPMTRYHPVELHPNQTSQQRNKRVLKQAQRRQQFSRKIRQDKTKRRQQSQRRQKQQLQQLKRRRKTPSYARLQQLQKRQLQQTHRKSALARQSGRKQKRQQQNPYANYYRQRGTTSRTGLNLRAKLFN